MKRVECYVAIRICCFFVSDLRSHRVCWQREMQEVFMSLQLHRKFYLSAHRNHQQIQCTHIDERFFFLFLFVIL